MMSTKLCQNNILEPHEAPDVVPVLVCVLPKGDGAVYTEVGVEEG